MSAPSKAARELARDLGFGSIDKSVDAVTRAEQIIQSALTEVLNRAQTLSGYIEVRWGDTDATIVGLNKPLASALEPWKEGE